MQRSFLSNAHSSNTTPDTYTDFTQGSDRFLIPGYLSISAGNAAASTATALTYEYDAGNSRTLLYGTSGALTLILAATPTNPTGNFTLTSTDFTFATHAGTESADTITGSGSNDLIYGFGGNDSIDGGAADDTIYGGDGNDTLFGSSGTDYLEAGAGSDLYFYSIPSNSYPAARDTLVFVQGEDRIYLNGLLGMGVVAGGATGYAAGYTYSAGTNLTTIFSNYGQININFSIQLVGNVAVKPDDMIFANTTVGTTGNDFIVTLDRAVLGDSGDDVIFQYATARVGETEFASGGSGNDLIIKNNANTSNGGVSMTYADTGNDTFYGGSANNDGLYSSSTGNVLIYGLGGADDLRASTGTAQDTIYGGSGNENIMAGCSGISLMYGEAGSDALYGYAGADTLVGGAGNDSLYGGNATSSLTDGNDTMIGGGGTCVSHCASSPVRLSATSPKTTTHTASMTSAR